MALLDVPCRNPLEGFHVCSIVAQNGTQEVPLCGSNPYGIQIGTPNDQDSEN